MIGLSFATVSACVDQPLTVVETPASSGGTGSVIGEIGGTANHHGTGGSEERSVGGNGASDGSGGRGGSTKELQGGSSSESHDCSLLGESCDGTRLCCGKSGLDCDYAAGECRKENGSFCIASDECKSNSRCKGGYCFANVTCMLIGGGCNSPSDCCSGHCLDRKCQELEGCKPVREYSSTDWNCCSGKLSTSAGLSACDYDYERGCKLAGETCGSYYAWDASVRRCCDGLECIAGPEGVTRCTSKATISTNCNIARDCAIIGKSEPHCIKHAATDPVGKEPPGETYGTCQVCVNEGGACQVNYDCCADEGLVCRDDVCTKAVSQSTPSCGTSGARCEGSSSSAGGSSTTAVPCCENYKCDTDSSQCVKAS